MLKIKSKKTIFWSNTFKWVKNAQIKSPPYLKISSLDNQTKILKKSTKKV